MRIHMNRPEDPNTQRARVEKILRDAISEGITDFEVIGDGLNYNYVPSLIWQISKRLWEEAFDNVYEAMGYRYPKGQAYRDARMDGYYRYICVHKETYGGRKHVFVHIDYSYPQKHIAIHLPKIREERKRLLLFDENWNEKRRAHGIASGD